MNEALDMTKSQVMMKIKDLKQKLIKEFNSTNYDYGHAHSLAWQLMDYVQDVSLSSKYAVNLEILTDKLNLSNIQLTASDKALAMNYLQHI